MKIALVQSHIIWEDKEGNLSRLEKTVSENRDTDLFLLPEMSFTGFSMNTVKTAERGRETAERVRRIAAGSKVCIGFGWVRQAGEKCENVYTILGREGQLLSEFVKIHPFSYSGEGKYFTGGDRTGVSTIEGIPCSTFICYDLRFPEVFRPVCRDAHVFIIPANWPAKRSEHWNALLKARAIENQAYILAINCVGEMGGLYYSGDSCVIDPLGNVLMSLTDREGLLKYELNDDTERVRNAFPVLDDIKPVGSIRSL